MLILAIVRMAVKDRKEGSNFERASDGFFNWKCISKYYRGSCADDSGTAAESSL